MDENALCCVAIPDGMDGWRAVGTGTIKAGGKRMKGNARSAPRQLGWDGIVLKAGIVYFIMNWHERIVADPGVLAGKPVIRGTRMAVEFVLDLLANGWSEEEILKNYPRLTAEDIRACFGWKSVS